MFGFFSTMHLKFQKILSLPKFHFVNDQSSRVMDERGKTLGLFLVQLLIFI